MGNSLLHHLIMLLLLLLVVVFFSHRLFTSVSAECVNK